MLQAALFSPGGALTAISPVTRGDYGSAPPVLSLDGAGGGIVAQEGREDGAYRYLLLGGDRFGSWGRLRHGPNNAQSTVEVAATTSGLGLATWVEEPAEASEHPRWEGRIVLDEIQLGGGPGAR